MYVWVGFADQISECQTLSFILVDISAETLFCQMSGQWSDAKATDFVFDPETISF